jgi:hypothetical protein
LKNVYNKTGALRRAEAYKKASINVLLNKRMPLTKAGAYEKASIMWCLEVSDGINPAYRANSGL